MRILIVLVLALNLSACTPGMHRRSFVPADTWYPFSLPNDLDKDSPANLGKLVLDAPAGRHGFVTSNEDQLTFTNGAPIKFWGTNLVGEAAFPDKAQAEWLADRLAFFGFNAVRFTRLDQGFAPKGIFIDPSPAYLDWQMKETGFVSQEQLRKLDYLIYLLKQRGIYTTFNLLSARRFSRADHVMYTERLGEAARPISVFDKRMIQLQKDYARGLLTHKNPYTGLTYIDDPAVALIEISHNNSLLSAWEDELLDVKPLTEPDGPIPKFYQKKLDQLWNDWLSYKYVTVKRTIVNWALHTVYGKETPILYEDHDWSLRQKGDASALIEKTPETTVFRIKKVGTEDEHLEYRRINVSFEAHNSYVFKFHASAPKRTPVTLVVQDFIDGFPYEILRQTVFVEPQEQTFSVPFNIKNKTEEAQVSLLLGSAPGDITFKGITVKHIDTLQFIADEQNKDSFTFHRPLHKYQDFYPPRMIEDMRAFYQSLQKDYFTEMALFLKNELHVRVPITGIGGYQEIEDIPAQKACDYIGIQTEWDKPRTDASGKALKLHKRSVLADEHLHYIEELRKHGEFPKPVVITEWHSSFPNPHRYEMPLLMAQIALQERWDGVFQYAFTEKLPENLPTSQINNASDIIENPQQLILSAVGSVLFLKGRYPRTTYKHSMMKLISPQVETLIGRIKHRNYQMGSLTITPEDDGSVSLVALDGKTLLDSQSMLLIPMSDIQNHGSTWKDSTHFDWGQAPTELQNMQVMISPDYATSPKPMALDAQGKVTPHPNNPEFAPLQLNRSNQVQSPWYWVTTQNK